jgi:hypothetical protein
MRPLDMIPERGRRDIEPIAIGANPFFGFPQSEIMPGHVLVKFDFLDLTSTLPAVLRKVEPPVFVDPLAAAEEVRMILAILFAIIVAESRRLGVIVDRTVPALQIDAGNERAARGAGMGVTEADLLPLSFTVVSGFIAVAISADVSVHEDVLS